MIIRPFDVADTEAVVALWRECDLARPWNDPYRDIARKLTVQPELFLVGVEPQGLPDTPAEMPAPLPMVRETSTQNGSWAVVATAMVGFDGHRGWVNYLAVSSAWQRRGYASQLMAEAEALLTARGCPKLNLQVRSGNSAAVEFYRALGYLDDNTVSFGKRLIADD